MICLTQAGVTSFDILGRTVKTKTSTEKALVPKVYTFPGRR